MTKSEIELECGGDGRRRVVIEDVAPQVEGGRFPAKAIVGELVEISAAIFADGHDLVAAELRHGPIGGPSRAIAMTRPAAGDRFTASFRPEALGEHRYTLSAWIDRFGSWRRDTLRKAAAGQRVALELKEGAALLREAATHEAVADSWLAARAEAIEGACAASLTELLDEALTARMREAAPRRFVTHLERELALLVERPLARFSAWYELFPRSTAPQPGRHGTFRDVVARLPYVQKMGFDILYLPPIHPIGASHRKGKNNAPLAEARDVGSPWAIGAAEGGHKAVHPDLGTMADFEALVAAAHDHGLEIALDVAFQCSPDHPYVREHPEWFRHRADGTIKYAENPPKKYEDVFPFDFECDAFPALWEELASIFTFWIERGVTIFRVDNPHTKPFSFWEWLIARIRREHPEVILLSEAFARPPVMYRLAKLGFSQSYQYFPWKTTKPELEAFFRECTRPAVQAFFRSSSWPNTPDILHAFLQYGGRAAFAMRAALAATLSASWGIYGPPFELVDQAAVRPGSEEYLDSEKYEIRHWNLDEPHSIAPLIARLNAIRRAHPALQSDARLRFHGTDNERLLCYSKTTADGSDVLLVVVSLDPHQRQAGHVSLSLEDLFLAPDTTYQAHDLLGGARFVWHGARNLVEIDPHQVPAQIFHLLRQRRTETDFEYFL
jgi:starch synthase (maltosyl-transferring)